MVDGRTKLLQEKTGLLRHLARAVFVLLGLAVGRPQRAQETDRAIDDTSGAYTGVFAE